ncbi:MAG: universal stress protein [Vicinamibacterales bacterium]
MNSPLVLCAVDLGPSTRRVLLHAVGLSRLLGARLRILHVAADDSAELRAQIVAECERAAPYEATIDPASIFVGTGRVSETIQREALRHHAALVVMGSRGHGGLARMLLGSTSEAFLGLARTPVLLVPPNDFDIVSLGDRPALTCGPVLAAVDLAEVCEHQLRMASEMAQLSTHVLILLTVARSKISDHDAAHQLRERAHGLAPIKPRSLIVRRGDVAEEISRCAVTEGTGLVVMGLRERPRGRPGIIASAVLKTGRAFVLAVPGC